MWNITLFKHENSLDKLKKWQLLITAWRGLKTGLLGFALHPCAWIRPQLQNNGTTTLGRVQITGKFLYCNKSWEKMVRNMEKLYRFVKLFHISNPEDKNNSWLYSISKALEREHYRIKSLKFSLDKTVAKRLKIFFRRPKCLRLNILMYCWFLVCPPKYFSTLVSSNDMTTYCKLK